MRAGDGELGRGGGEPRGAFSEMEDGLLPIEAYEDGREPPGMEGGRASGGRALPTTGDFCALSVLDDMRFDVLVGGGGGVDEGYVFF